MTAIWPRELQNDNKSSKYTDIQAKIYTYIERHIYTDIYKYTMYKGLSNMLRRDKEGIPPLSIPSQIVIWLMSNELYLKPLSCLWRLGRWALLSSNDVEDSYSVIKKHHLMLCMQP